MAGQSPERVAEAAEGALREILHTLTGDRSRLEKSYREKTVPGTGKSNLKRKGLFGAAGSLSETDQKLKAPESLVAVNRLFYRRGWTDGLPIIPPTEARIQRMLGQEGWDPDTLIGRVAPGDGEATAGKIAANAVMAGCLPDHLPVVIAATRALIKRRFNLYAVQTTTHPCAVLVLVNGPLADPLDINAGYNVMGQGCLGNAVIGRAVRLVLVNLGGAAPGILDRATQGSPAKYSFCFAENEAQSPWEPLHVERGFEKSVSTVTVSGAESPHNVNDHGGNSAEEILLTVAGVLATPGTNNLYLGGEPMVVLGPEHAAVIHRDGFTKGDVKRFLFEKARLSVSAVSKGNLERFGKNHPERFSRLDKKDTILLVDAPEEFMVVVAGGMGRHSAVIPTFGGHARSVTLPIVDPKGEPIFPKTET